MHGYGISTLYVRPGAFIKEIPLIFFLLQAAHCTGTQKRHKSKKSEMFGSIVADKYASVVTKHLGLAS